MALSIGGALVAATASLVGPVGGSSCRSHGTIPCADEIKTVVGAPMNCPTMYVSQGFGNTPWEHPHTGIDLVCPPDTMVVAVADGIFHRDQGQRIRCLYPVGRIGGLGTYGVLDADGRAFLYGHLDAFAAADGAHVPSVSLSGSKEPPGARQEITFISKSSREAAPVDPCPLLPAGYPDQHDPSGLRCWGSALP